MMKIVLQDGGFIFLNEDKFLYIDFDIKNERICGHLENKEKYICGIRHIEFNNEVIIFKPEPTPLKEEDLDIDICNIDGLFERTIPIFRLFGINTIRQLSKISFLSLSKILNIGRKTLSEVSDYYVRAGIKIEGRYLIAHYKDVGGKYRFDHFEFTDDMSLMTSRIIYEIPIEDRPYYEEFFRCKFI